MEEEKEIPRTKKQQKTSRWWIGTWNNPGVAWVSVMKTFYSTIGATYVIAQLEKGEQTGTPHIQFTCYFDQPKKLSHFAGIPAHMEAVLSVKASVMYCQKSETRLEGPCEWGIKPKSAEKKAPIDWEKIWQDAKAGKLEEIPAPQRVTHYTKLRMIQKDYLLMQPGPRYLPNRVAYWIWGEPGVGKTYRAFKDFEQTLYPKLPNKWWDGYLPNYHMQVLLDDVQKEAVKWLHELLIRWSDKYLTLGEIKGSTTTLIYEHFIVTSNWSIEELYSNEPNAEMHIAQMNRRFISIHMTHRDQDIDW